MYEILFSGVNNKMRYLERWQYNDLLYCSVRKHNFLQRSWHNIAILINSNKCIIIVLSVILLLKLKLHNIWRTIECSLTIFTLCEMLPEISYIKNWLRVRARIIINQYMTRRWLEICCMIRLDNNSLIIVIWKDQVLFITVPIMPKILCKIALFQIHKGIKKSNANIIKKTNSFLWHSTNDNVESSQTLTPLNTTLFYYNRSLNNKEGEILLSKDFNPIPCFYLYR